MISPIKEPKETSEPDMYEFGIAENKELEQIIPVRFHKLINQLLLDYRELEDQRFWKKYNLDDIWFTIDEYRQDKRNEELLGQIIVNVLVNSGYILQLDYKENVEDFMDDIIDFWKTKEVKIVTFDLMNDQYYYAKIPQDSHLKRLYEVELIDTNKEV